MMVKSCWLTLLLVGSSIISVSPDNVAYFMTTVHTTQISSTILSVSSSTPTISSSRLDLQEDKDKSKVTTKETSNPNIISNSSNSHSNNTYNTVSTSIIFDRSSRDVKGRKDKDADLEFEKKVEEEKQRCQAFLTDDSDKKFFNPVLAPNSNYPANTNCTRILEAPTGFHVKLDFRDSFHIEPSDDCKYDFLEIRNGRYGFSDLIGKYCGTEYPPMIISKNRHLWIRFHSDENIEYKGFTAVYEFVAVSQSSIIPTINCTKNVTGFQGIINRDDIPAEVAEQAKSQSLPLDCLYIITVEKRWKIQLSFLIFKLEKPNECEKNFVDTFGDKPDEPSRIEKFCGSIADTAISSSNILHVRFYAEADAYKSNFSMLFTAYREKEKDSGGDKGCEEGEYDCEDTTCISDDLKCNGYNNCRFGWDEDECHKTEVEHSEHVIIIIIVFGLILGGMMATFIFNCTRKLIRDQKIIREHIRQSKESKLDEMGRASVKRSQENLSVKLNASREKTPQNSNKIIEEISNRYYREIVPISVDTSDIDIRKDSMKKQRNNITVQSSVVDEIDPDQNTCETGCQTRESLFQQTPFKKPSHTPTSASNQSTIRFSTFGYEIPPNTPKILNQQSQSTKKSNKRRPSPARTKVELELENLNRMEECTPPYEEPCHHHHQHQQHQPHLQQLHHKEHQNLERNRKNKQKIEETRRTLIDVRSSAPDVIIMTSQ